MSTKTESIENASILEAIKEVQGNLAQLTELQDLQTNYILRLIGSLRSLQTFIKETIPINASNLGCPHHNIKEAHLASEAQIIMIGEDGRITSEALSNLEPDKILMIITDCLPVINQIIAAKKQRVEERVELLEQLVKEFKKINETLNPIEETNLAEDVVQRTLSEA